MHYKFKKWFNMWYFDNVTDDAVDEDYCIWKRIRRYTSVIRLRCQNAPVLRKEVLVDLLIKKSKNELCYWRFR